MGRLDEGVSVGKIEGVSEKDEERLSGRLVKAKVSSFKCRRGKRLSSELRKKAW